MSAAITIAVVGDFNAAFQSHLATNKAIQMAAEAVGIPTKVEWVPTGAVSPGAPESALSAFDGLWAASGSPYRSFDGMLAGIRYARERGIPFTGT